MAAVNSDREPREELANILGQGIIHGSDATLAPSKVSPPLATTSIQEPELVERNRDWDILLAFSMLFFPMLGIVLVLLAFVFYSHEHVLFPDIGGDDLPVNLTSISNSSYYTTIPAPKFALVASWASTASQFVVPPFMLLFSYFVAREIAQQRETSGSNNETAEMLHNILNVPWPKVWRCLWSWLKYSFNERRSASKIRAIHVAALGTILAGFFSALLIAGDNWLHLAVKTLPERHYEPVTVPRNSSDDDWEYAGGWDLDPDCAPTVTAPLSTNDSILPLPCSLNSSTNILSVSGAVFAYQALYVGISQTTSEFNRQNLDRFNRSVVTNDSVVQVVTHVDPKTELNHAFLFYPYSAVEFDYDTSYTKFGVDYVANTTSMVTQCQFATQECQISQRNQSADGTLSIPFNCSNLFSGDLGKDPPDGLERLTGWDSSFYRPVDGRPKNISHKLPLNPFYFNISAAVNSIAFSDLQDVKPSSVADGSIVDAGSGWVAFALSCKATIYDVTFALINGSVTAFNATPSDPRKASIIKAPLQVGYGRDNLFQQASLALLSDQDSVEDTMGAFISQTGMALASAVFLPQLNIRQRYRWDMIVTKVPKGPLWFLVVVCLLYAALGLGVATTAFILRRRDRVAEVQATLVPKLATGLRELIKDSLGQVADLVGVKDLIKKEEDIVRGRVVETLESK